MPVLAEDSNSIIFGDFKYYQIVDRVGIRILRDPFTAKPYVRFYTTKRLGGDVVDVDAFKTLQSA
jgi:HK97 family phage major capsid protein